VTSSLHKPSEEELLIEQHRVFPFGPLLGALGCALGYVCTSHYVILGPIVPVVNALGCVALVVWGFANVKK
jgi:hypothetical protein